MRIVIKQEMKDNLGKGIGETRIGSWVEGVPDLNFEKFVRQKRKRAPAVLREVSFCEHIEASNKSETASFSLLWRAALPQTSFVLRKGLLQCGATRAENHQVLTCNGVMFPQTGPSN